MTICAHGTTLDNFRNILAGGEKPEGAWTVSSWDGAMYFYPLDKHITQCCLEDEEEEYQIESLVSEALGNAAITGAIGLKTTKLVVFLADVPTEWLEDDYSCDGMASCASYIPDYAFKREFITKVFTFDFLEMFAPYHLPLCNRHFNTSLIPDELLPFLKGVNTFYNGQCLEDSQEYMVSTKKEISLDNLDSLS